MADDNTTTTTTDAGSGSAGGTSAGNATPPSNEFVIPKAEGASAPTTQTDAATTTAAATSVAPKFDEIIPKEFHDRAWFKDFARAEKPFEAMTKGYEGALELSRKKDGIQIPTAESTPEQIKAFNDAWGVPAEPKGYKIPTVEWKDETEKQIGEQLAKSRTEDFNNNLLDIFHKAGLSQAQIDKLWVGYETLNAQTVKKALADSEEAQKKADAEFKQKFDSKFGAEAKAVRERVAAEMIEFVPKDLAAAMDSLTDEQLMAVTVFSDAIRKKYGREDSAINRRESFSTSDSKSLETRRMELMQEREKVYKEQGLHAPRYAEINQEIESIRNQLAETYK